jgi:uncharacterized phosphosugar-binding protein
VVRGRDLAMFIERAPGLAEMILANFVFGPKDVMIIFSASGLSAVRVRWPVAPGGAGSA